jgi:hypothetical protein
MSAVEYALAALVAGAVVALAVAAREVARLARTAEMIYALLYYSKPAAEEALVEGAGVERQGQQAAAQPPPAAEGAPQRVERQAEQQAALAIADECVVDLVRRYGCMSLADVKLKCGVGIMVLRRLRSEGRIKITNDGRVCPK